jgi:hypothetical protein
MDEVGYGPLILRPLGLAGHRYRVPGGFATTDASINTSDAVLFTALYVLLGLLSLWRHGPLPVCRPRAINFAPPPQGGFAFGGGSQRTSGYVIGRNRSGL